MATVNGFYYPDRCANCTFVQSALRTFEQLSLEQTGPGGESFVDEMRASRQAIFDMAEFVCGGTLAGDAAQPGCCQLMPSAERSNEQLKNYS